MEGSTDPSVQGAAGPVQQTDPGDGDKVDVDEHTHPSAQCTPTVITQEK